MRRLPFGLILAVILGLGGASASAGLMQAGTATAVISNTAPMVMVNGRMSAGVLYDIYTRVLVLNDGDGRFVFVANDLNCLDVATPLLRERVKKELAIDPARLIILATHNHNAPIQIVPDNFAYGEHLADIIFNTIQEAIANERGPVRLLLGSGEGAFVTAMGADIIDTEVQLLKVMLADTPMAMLFSHPVHPLQASQDQVEPGHPGYAVIEVERRIPGVTALYGASAGGNQFAVVPPDYRVSTKDAREKGPGYAAKQRELAARVLGSQLADVVLDIAAGTMDDVTGPISAELTVVSLPLNEPITREEAEVLAESFPDDVGFVPYPHEHRSTNWVRMVLRHYEKDIPFPTRTTDWVCTDDTYLIHREDTDFLAAYEHSIHKSFPCVYEEVVAARIGPMAFVAMQGEVCAPIGMRIKEAVRQERPILLFAYFGEHNLYIPTRAIVESNLYQARVLQTQYASPVSWSPDVEDVMVDKVLRLVDQAMGQ